MDPTSPDPLLRAYLSQVGRTRIIPVPVDLDVLVTEVRDEVVASEAAGREVHWSIAPLPRVRGDLMMLRLAIRNLLSNALKYTRNRPVAEVGIGSKLDGNAHIIKVYDNGVGFDMAYSEKLFGVFQRLHRMKDFEGTGIGLANVRRVVERHGGRVWADGKVNQGATFYISHPAEARWAMLKPILLVEDNPRELELTLLALAKSQLANEVVTIRDGAEVLDYLHRRGAYSERGEGNPAVVLLDLKLPKVDGIQVLREIKNDPNLRGVPVVMLTPSREERDLIGSYALGVNAYVVKPVDFSAFLEPDDRERSRSAGFDDHLVKPVDPGYLREYLIRFPGNNCLMADGLCLMEDQFRPAIASTMRHQPSGSYFLGTV